MAKSGRHCSESRSVAQEGAALSAGEAELPGAAEDAGTLIGAVTMMRRLGVAAKGGRRANSSAAKGIVCRRGLGKVTHVDVRNMWIQDVVRPGRNAIVRIPAGEDAADVLARRLDGPAAARHMKRLGCVVEGGRRKLAPEVKVRATGS